MGRHRGAVHPAGRGGRPAAPAAETDVDDAATAEPLVDPHTHLDAGADPATALHAVRAARPDGPTAASFVALGI